MYQRLKWIPGLLASIFLVGTNLCTLSGHDEEVEYLNKVSYCYTKENMDRKQVTCRQPTGIGNSVNQSMTHNPPPVIPIL